jgi:hypothetical protein
MSYRDTDKKNTDAHYGYEEVKEMASLNVRVSHLEDEIEKQDTENTDRHEEVLAKIDGIRDSYDEQMSSMRESIQTIKDDRTKQLIDWGTRIIIALLACIGAIIMKVAIPLLLAYLKK